MKAKRFVNYQKNVNTTGYKDKIGNRDNVLNMPRYNVEGLKEESTVFLYKLRPAGKMHSTKTGTVEERYTWLRENLHQAAKEALGEKANKCSKNKQPYWWSDTVEEAVKGKRAAYNRGLQLEILKIARHTPATETW